MSKTDVIFALNALSQMVQPHGSVLNRTTAVTIRNPKQLEHIAQELGVEPDFGTVMRKIQTDESATAKIQQIYTEWQKTAVEDV